MIQPAGTSFMKEEVECSPLSMLCILLENRCAWGSWQANRKVVVQLASSVVEATSSDWQLKLNSSTVGLKSSRLILIFSMSQTRMAVNRHLIFQHFMYRHDGEKSSSLMHRKVTTSRWKNRCRCISVKTCEGSENLVDQDLEFLIIHFSESCAVSARFIICVQAPDIAENLQTVVEQREEDALRHDGEPLKKKSGAHKLRTFKRKVTIIESFPRPVTGTHVPYVTLNSMY